MRCAELWRDLRDGLADLLLPITCVCCGDLLGSAASDGLGSIVCTRCWASVRRLGHPQCARCGYPVPPLELSEFRLDAGTGQSVGALQRRCGWCALLPPFVRAVRSVCWVHRGTGADLVHALKYGGWTRLAQQLARPMAHEQWPTDVVEERTALIPVPLTATRQRERGFNQSAVLADFVARSWNLPVWADVLERVRATRTQTRLSPEQREANVSGAFGVRAGARERVRGTHLILVDDVVTTCATMNACAAALFDAGTRLISYLTFGRAPAAGDRG